MKWNFSHPYKDNLNLSIGQFTQVVGQDQQLKYYLWQLIIWYFDGKKYKEEDLSIFEQQEPVIVSNGEIIKRNQFRIISISDIRDLLEQMTYKKGTVAFDFMKNNLNNVQVMTELDEINDRLDEISLLVNQQLGLELQGIKYHVESVYFTVEQLLAKNFLPYFQHENKNIAFEYVDNEVKVLLLLEMLKSLLAENPEPILLIFKNLDDYLSHTSFIKLCQEIEIICQKFPYFQVIIFPSNEGYLYITKENMQNINIISDYIEHLYDFEFTYERFCGQYPSNQKLDEEVFLNSLCKNVPYLFSTDIEYVSLSVSDLVTIKIMNQLYHYDKRLFYPIAEVNPLELSFLQDNH